MALSTSHIDGLIEGYAVLTERAGDKFTADWIRAEVKRLKAQDKRRLKRRKRK